MSRQTQPSGRSKADIRRSELIYEAAKLFDEEGYHSTTVDEIAEAVGIRKPTLYHYFKRKDEILFWIHEEFIDLLIAQQEARQATRMTPSQTLLEVMADMLEVIETRRGHVRVFFEHYRELPEADQQTIKRKRDAYHQMVQDTIRHGCESGAFRRVDPRLATLALFGMCNWAYQWYSSEGPLRSREIAYVFWDLFLRGLERDARDGNP